MNKKRWMIWLVAGVLAVDGGCAVVSAATKDTTEEFVTEATDGDGNASASEEDTAGISMDSSDAGMVIAVDGDVETAVFAEDGTPVSKTKKASDMGYPVQDSYSFPYLGLEFTLPDTLKTQMGDSDVLMMTTEEWTEDLDGLKYAFFSWSQLTVEQKQEEVDLLGTGFSDWMDSLTRIGALGVYRADVEDDLDEITGCTEHKQLGMSADGAFLYYLSINPNADDDLTKEIQQIEFVLTSMTSFNSSQSVFDQPAADTNTDAANVGAFETADINGTAYTESVFNEYDLTLVNAFTTWCSPCVNEMPELEELYQEMKDQGVGVVGMVIDSVDEEGNIDETVVEKAKILQEKTGVTYPLLIPDSGFLNGRIQGLQSFPESFFVDKDGNIVSDAILGSNDLQGWKEAVDQQLKSLTDHS